MGKNQKKDRGGIVHETAKEAKRRKKNEHELDLISFGICPKCEQNFASHNDDGSCVQD